MPSAHRRHFGSARKLPSGRYQARYKHAGATHVAPGTFTTKSDALAWLSAAETDIHRGAWTAPKAGKITLAVYGKAWLDGRSDLRPVTRVEVRAHARAARLADLGERTSWRRSAPRPCGRGTWGCVSVT